MNSPQRGEIWIVDLGPVAKTRPAMVVSIPLLDDDRALVGRPQRAGASPGDLLQGEAQGLGVGEFAVEQVQRRLQRRELFVGEGDRPQVEVLGAQRVVLLLGGPVGRALDRQLDAQRFELGAVGVEAPREGVLVHAAVALDVGADLQGRDRAPLRHQVGDQRKLADELFGVLRHGGTQP